MRLFFAVVLAGLFGCGESDSSTDGNSTVTFGETELVIVNKDTFVASESSLVGTATVIANTALPSVDSGNHFVIAGALENSSTVSLIANGSNTGENGLVLNFMNDANTLKVSMEFSGSTVDISSRFAGRSSTALSYKIDIHNDETPAHVLVWDGALTEFAEETALFNSEDGPAAPGNGTGAYWGATLNSSTLTTLSRSEPVFEEE